MKLRGIEVLTSPDALNQTTKHRPARPGSDRTVIGLHNMFIYISFGQKPY
jgi:hypothetical protein